MTFRAVASTAVVMTMALAAAACGGSKPRAADPPPPPPIDAAPPPPPDASAGRAALDAMNGFAERICACNDQDCATDVAKEMAKWADAHAAEYKDYEPSQAEQAEATEIGTKMSKCTMALVPPPAGITPAQAIEAMTGFADKMCACKDKACTEKVAIDVGDWAQANSDAFSGVTPTAEETAKMDKLGTRLATCAQKFAPKTKTGK